MQISRSQLHNLRSQTLVGERNANTKRLVNALKRMLTNDRRNFNSPQLLQHAKKIRRTRFIAMDDNFNKRIHTNYTTM